MKFVGLVGSNYDQSYNRKLLEFIRRNFKLKFELEVLEIDEVPMFNQDEKWDESFQLRKPLLLELCDKWRMTV